MRKEYPNNTFYPYTLCLTDARAVIMLLLYDTILFKDLYDTSYLGILEDHSNKVLHLNLKPGYAENMKEKIEKLKVVGSIRSDTTLMDIMVETPRDQDDENNDSSAIWTKDFKIASRELWEAGYPLIFWNRQGLGGGNDVSDAIKDVIHFRSDMLFSDGYNKAKNDPNYTGLKEKIHAAMSLGVLTLHDFGRTTMSNRYGNGWCCDTFQSPPICMPRPEEPEFFCSMVVDPERDDECSLFSTPCL